MKNQKRQGHDERPRRHSPFGSEGTHRPDEIQGIVFSVCVGDAMQGERSTFAIPV